MRIGHPIYYFIVIIAAMTLLLNCTIVQKAKTGDDAFDRKQYFIAASLYEKEFEANTNPTIKAKRAYGAAVAYQKINESSQSAQWFKQAADLDFGDVAWKEYGLALIQLGQYDEAIRSFETILNRKGSSEEFRLLISSAKQAKLLALEQLKIYVVSPLTINTAAAEYAPSIDPKGNLIFTSDRPSGTGEEIYKWTGRKFSDLYSAALDEPNAVLYDSELNTRANEGTACFNQSGTAILFTRCELNTVSQDGYCKIMLATKNEIGRWTAPIPLPFQKEGINYMHPCLAANDSVVFFAADDQKGEGGFDIYYSEWVEGQWQAPERLGQRINTTSHERFPFMYADTLYFASDRLGGLGGLDIYKSFVNEEGEWQPAINLRSPINSSEDDFALVIDPTSAGSTLKGYFSTSRIGGAGKDDIYRFERSQTDESILTVVKPKPAPAPKKPIFEIYLSMQVVQAIRANPEDPNSPVIEKRPLPNALILLKEGTTPIQMTANANGAALRKVLFDQDYFVLAGYPGLLNASKTIRTTANQDSLNPITNIHVEIMLDKAYTGKEVIISDIFYDLDKWNIRPDAEPSLNELTQLLKDNPKINIQLSSHTDCRGNTPYNQDLSQKRAQSAIDFLAKSGIQSNRLIPKGFGESMLIKNCICEKCTEEEHQANRRTTFTILQ